MEARTPFQLIDTYRATITIEMLQTRFHAMRRLAKLDVTAAADPEGNSAPP